MLEAKLLSLVNPTNAPCEAIVGAVLEKETSVCDRRSRKYDKRVIRRSNCISAASCAVVGLGFLPFPLPTFAEEVADLGLNPEIMTANRLDTKIARK